jgi:hypothetical protein
MIRKYHYLVIVSSKFTEGSCLLLEKGDERLKRVARLKLGGKWMFDEVCPCPVFIFLAGSLKKSLENRGFRRCTHITISQKPAGGL